MNVSPRTVVAAKTVLNDGTPEEIAAINSGDAAVTTTANNIRKRKKKDPAGAGPVEKIGLIDAAVTVAQPP